MLKLAIISRDHEAYQQAFEILKDNKGYTDIDLFWADEHAEGLALSDANIILGNPNICSTYIDQCANLIWFQSTWAGVTPLISQAKRDYLLTGLKGVFGAQMREYVMAYVLLFQRKVEAFNARQSNKHWEQELLPTLKGKVMGIMGLGDIGHDVAQAAKAFGMQIHSLNAHSRPAIADKHFHLSSLVEFTESCDVIVNLLPHTPDTDGICDDAFFNATKPECIFINGGRGNVIADDAMLVKALNERRLKAAVLDVFKQEPLPKEHPFWTTKQLYITNHTAASSMHASVFELFTENLSRFRRKQDLIGKVDFKKGY